MTKLNSGDQVKDVMIAPNTRDLVIYSKKKALRCKLTDIPNYKRNTLGVYAMNTKGPIDGISIIDENATDIVVITESGKINKFDITGLPMSERYKAGNTVIKLGKMDTIHSLFSVNDSNALHILTRNNRIDIPVNEIQRTSSISPGSKKIPMKGDNIIKITVE